MGAEWWSRETAESSCLSSGGDDAEQTPNVDTTENIDHLILEDVIFLISKTLQC